MPPSEQRFLGSLTHFSNSLLIQCDQILIAISIIHDKLYKLGLRARILKMSSFSNNLENDAISQRSLVRLGTWNFLAVN